MPIHEATLGTPPSQSGNYGSWALLGIDVLFLISLESGLRRLRSKFLGYGFKVLFLWNELGVGVRVSRTHYQSCQKARIFPKPFKIILVMK